MSARVVLKRGQRPNGKPARKLSANRPRKRSARPVSRPWIAPVIAVSVAVAALGGAWVYQLPDRLWLAAAKGVAAAGFEVRTVEVSGIREMQKLPLYTAALDGASDSMLLVDLDDVKDRLELLPWVAEASVGRVLPDTLLIDVTERTPAAIWQNDGMHRLVDVDGRILQTEDLSRFAHLPLIVDEGADKEIATLTRLLKDYPAFAAHFASATWRGGRRWDVQLKSGEMILLPEGDGATRRALDSFVRLERDTQLTGRGFAALDFRVPKQMIVRAGSDSGEALMTIDGTEI